MNEVPWQWSMSCQVPSWLQRVVKTRWPVGKRCPLKHVNETLWLVDALPGAVLVTASGEDALTSGKTMSLETCQRHAVIVLMERRCRVFHVRRRPTTVFTTYTTTLRHVPDVPAARTRTNWISNSRLTVICWRTCPSCKNSERTDRTSSTVAKRPRDVSYLSV